MQPALPNPSAWVADVGCPLSFPTRTSRAGSPMPCCLTCRMYSASSQSSGLSAFETRGEESNQCKTGSQVGASRRAHCTAAVRQSKPACSLASPIHRARHSWQAAAQPHSLASVPLKNTDTSPSWLRVGLGPNGGSGRVEVCVVDGGSPAAVAPRLASGAARVASPLHRPMLWRGRRPAWLAAGASTAQPAQTASQRPP